MYLTYRLAQVKDLSVGIPIAVERLTHLGDCRSEIQALSTELIDSGMVVTVIIEDRDQDPDKRMAAIAIIFCANEEFAAFVKDPGRKPFLARHAVDWWKKKRSISVSLEEFYREQSLEGSIFTCLLWGVDRQRYDHKEFLKIREQVSVAAQALGVTYRMKEYLEETYGQEELTRLLTFGFVVYNDFDAAAASKEDQERHPYLIGADFLAQRRADKPDRPETFVGKHVMLSRPRFGFTFREQEVLRRALQGNSDEEIAEALGLTVIAIKNRWQGIYDRVRDVDADLFAEPEDEEGGGGRAKQRRRMLIQLLREHPEELWPNAKAKASIQ
jgi:DNA-binding CsgD family transcriptional regulator